MLQILTVKDTGSSYTILIESKKKEDAPSLYILSYYLLWFNTTLIGSYSYQSFYKPEHMSGATNNMNNQSTTLFPPRAVTRSVGLRTDNFSQLQWMSRRMPVRLRGSWRGVQTNMHTIERML